MIDWNIDTAFWPGPSGLPEYDDNGALVLNSIHVIAGPMGDELTVRVPPEEYDIVMIGQLVRWSNLYDTGIVTEKKKYLNVRNELCYIVMVLGHARSTL